MRKKKTSPSSLFLLEIMVNILIFAVLLCICLQFFIKAHNLTKSTTELQRAVTVCANIASLYEAGDGSMEFIDDAYPNSVILDNHMVIFLDQNFLSCRQSDSVYTITVAYDTDNDALQSIAITCAGRDGEIYSITAKHYHQRTIAQGGQL